MEFCDKLKYVMNELNIKSAELARHVHVNPTLVCRWRSGERKIDNNAQLQVALAEYLESRVETEAKRNWLGRLLADYEKDEISNTQKLLKWLYDNKKKEQAIPSTEATPAGVCLLGSEGFLTAVSMLEYAIKSKLSLQAITVYISTEKMSLLLDKKIDVLWERLFAIQKRPIPIILEQSGDADGMSTLFSLLLPHIYAGRIQLFHLPSTQRHFCYNITVIAKNVGMAMAMEGSVAGSGNISFFVDSPSFVNSIAIKLSELCELASPVFRIIQNVGRQRNIQIRCYSEEKALLSQFGTVNLLYASPESYRILLKKNGVPYETVRYQLKQFEERRAAFKAFIQRGQYREIMPLHVLQALSDGVPPSPFLDFIPGQKIMTPLCFVKSLLQGVVEFIKQYPSLEIILDTKRSENTAIEFIKQDDFLWCNDLAGDETIHIYSDNWLFVNGFERRFEERWQSAGGVFGRENVLYVLTREIKKLVEKLDIKEE